MAIIEVDHVTKEYQLGQLQSIKQSAVNTLDRLRGRPVTTRPPFKALDDVHFTVQEGEVLGIIGHNGAGKSTLLKLLANISKPTHGNVRIKGRIAPLIEVGAGFVPDLTGRENVYLNGSILGLSRREIDKKFDDIVDFAEMSEFIDTPVKRYSSGMQVKLAFSVATSIEAEILIVDEVLAVGDLAFQRKCFDRMEESIKRQGRTVLLVSHNIRQVERLCSRVLLLSHGTILEDGEARPVCNNYYEIMDSITHKRQSGSSRDSCASPSVHLTLLELKILDGNGKQTEEISYKQPVTFVMTYHVLQRLVKPIFAIGMHTTDLLYITANRSNEEIITPSIEPGVHEVRFHTDGFPLMPGSYSIRASVVAIDPVMDYFYSENIISFRVVASDFERSSFAGEGFLEIEGIWSTPQSSGLHDSTEQTIQLMRQDV